VNAVTENDTTVTYAVCDAAEAGDTGLVARVTRLVNDAYAVAEKGLWLGGAKRTDVAEVGSIIAAGELVAARRGPDIAGVVRVRQLDGGEGEFGMLAVDPAYRSAGIGRGLVSFAEGLSRGRGSAIMQLELLVPQTWAHPEKEFLRTWYTRLGYRQVRIDALADMYPDLAPHLATPCDHLVFHKPL
jgi:ribosomal protein S18 acetylase RimI-like enzyme